MTVPAAELSVPEGGWIRVGGAEIGPGRAEGGVETEALKASWNLTFAGDDEPCKYLPADWLYEAPVPRTKFVAPYPNARFDGRLEIDGTEIDLAGWPGMIGHNWGSEHAERWVWLEGTGFDGASDSLVRRRRGADQARALDDVLGAVGDARPRRRAAPARRPRQGPRGEDLREPDRLRVRPAGQGRRPSAGGCPAPRRTSSAGSTRTRRAPSTTRVNCSIADLELTVERKGSPPRTLSLPGGGRIRVRNAGDRPRDPDPAVSGRLTAAAEPLTTFLKYIQRS